jgi:hypothetical protein
MTHEHRAGPCSGRDRAGAWRQLGFAAHGVQRGCDWATEHASAPAMCGSLPRYGKSGRPRLLILVRP